MLPNKEEILKEITFKTSRSGGKGGQNVNKVSSKVEVVFNLLATQLFTAEQKQLLIEKLQNRMDNDGNIHIVSQEDRSQLMNKQRTILKLMDVLHKGLQVQKKRKPSKLPKAVKEKRLANKAVNSQKKEGRRKPNFD